MKKCKNGPAILACMKDIANICLLQFICYSVNNILENYRHRDIVTLDVISNLNFFVQLCGHVLRLNLKTPNWKEQTEKEIELCTNNTIPLCENVEPISVTNGDELYSKLVLCFPFC